MPPPTSTTSLRQSTSSMSFLSPSRSTKFVPMRNHRLPSAPSSPAPSSSIESIPGRPLSGTPQRSALGASTRRRPIYLGPGMNASQRRPGSGSTLRALGSLEAVRRAEAGAEGSTESPGKRRRLEDDEDGGKMEEKIGFSGTGTYASSMLGASRSVPDFRSSTTTPAATPQKPTAGAASTSPFTFSVPFSSSTTPQQTPQSSVPDSTRATTISAKPSSTLR